MAYIYTSQDDISLTYFKKDFERYSWSSLRSDMMAGLAVSMLTLPQSLAFALVAGLPVSTGLYAAIFSSIIVALFGSSRHLIVGPSNAIAILIQGGISTVLFTYYRDVTGPEREELVLQILTQLMLLVGLIQILAAFLKLGRLTHFVSHTVTIAYVSGVALALVINQLFPLLGMDVPANVSSLYERSVYILTHLYAAHLPTALIGGTCFLFLIVLRRIDRKIPAGAIMLATVALLAYFLDYFYHYFQFNDYQFLDWKRVELWVQGIAVVGDTQGNGFIPKVELPYFDPGILNNLLPVAFAIALLSVMEATATTKTIAASSGQHLSTNQEIFGLGLGNFFSAFIGAMPLSGSTSRSSINYENGAKSRLAALFNSLYVYLLIVAFGFLIRHIPITAFAALLIVSSGNIVNIKQLFLCLKATRSDAFVLVLTLLSCLFLSLDIAFYIGVAMSISLYLKKAAIPQLIEFKVDEFGVLHALEDHHQNEPRKIRFIKVEGELFFGAADIFQSTLKSITEDDTTTRVIILQLKNARDIDATACLALQHLHDYLKSSGRHLIACGITHQVWDVLSDSGMIEIVGKNNLFIFDERHPYLSVQKAFLRGNDLLNAESAKASDVQAPANPSFSNLQSGDPSSMLSPLNPEEELKPAT
ncbi:MAG: SulP family inorganic anion transporter [Parachlamydiaceae bacterium]